MPKKIKNSPVSLTLYLLGTWKPGNAVGGLIWPPSPSLSHVYCLMSKYNKWYIIGKLLCFNFRICQKICKFAKYWIFYRKIQLYSKNVCKTNFCPKNEKLYIFEINLTMPFQICKNFCKILNNLIFNPEKLKMCKFPLTGCLQKICDFFPQNLCNPFPYVIGFPKS